MSPITTLTIQTLTKKNPSDICLKPKKVYKLYDAKLKIKKIEKNLETKF